MSFNSCGTQTLFEYACKDYYRTLVRDKFMRDLGIHTSYCYNILICFSLIHVESIDDMKIVSYHWEEIKGPLREQKASADTPVLHLSKLVPGNYTFRYACVDTSFSGCKSFLMSAR